MTNKCYQQQALMASALLMIILSAEPVETERVFISDRDEVPLVYQLYEYELSPVLKARYQSIHQDQSRLLHFSYKDRPSVLFKKADVPVSFQLHEGDIP